MGCDIHMFIEVKKENQWNHFNWRDEKYLIGNYEDGSKQYSYDKYFDDPLYVGRNYDLFAVLANVRNGRGFAGIKTGEGFNYIAEPKGLPFDVSKDILQESDEWDGDGHSHSWFTLRELLDFDYVGQYTTQCGVVDENEYREFHKRGKPKEWSGGVSGGMVTIITNQQMEDLLSGEYPRDTSRHYYTNISWNENYHQAIGEHWFVFLRELEKLGNPEDVRIVFWFDN